MAHSLSPWTRFKWLLWVRVVVVWVFAPCGVLHLACSTGDSQRRPHPARSAGGVETTAGTIPAVAVDLDESMGSPSTAGGPSGMGGAGHDANDGEAFAGGSSSERAIPTPLDRYARVAGPMGLDGLEGVSGITYRVETDSFFVLSDTTHSLYEYTSDFAARLRTVLLDNGPMDSEDVFYLGEDRFAVAFESNEIFVLTVDALTEVADMNAGDVEHYVVTALPVTMNTGFEGVTLRTDIGAVGQFIVCQEGGSGVPIRVLLFDRSPQPGTFSYEDGSLRVREPWEALVSIGELASDLSAATFDESSQTLLLLSHASSNLLRVDPDTGDVLDARDLVGSPQYEGVTLASDRRLVLVSEPNLVEIYRAPDD